MTYYFMGSEIPGLVPSSSSVYERAITDGFARAETSCGGGGDLDYAFVPDLPDLDTFYFHGFGMHDSSGAGLQTAMAFVNNAGVEILRMRWSGTTILFESHATGSWLQLGATVTAPSTSKQEIDIFYDAQASGNLKLYIGGTERFAYAGDLSGCANIAEIRLKGYAFAGVATGRWHGVMVADIPLIGYRLGTFYPSGAGSDSGWVSGFTTIDEAVHNDGDYIASATANQISTFALTGPDLTGYAVAAVGVAARAKRGASGPANLQLTLRSGGTNYFSASKALDIGYETKLHVWEDNPATSVPFLTSEIASLQAGVKSIA